MVIAAGIGVQGALPGCALYGGATCEGIGRFIYLDSHQQCDTIRNIENKIELCKECALLALDAKRNEHPYPTDAILDMLSKHHPHITSETHTELVRICNARGGSSR